MSKDFIGYNKFYFKFYSIKYTILEIKMDIQAIFFFCIHLLYET